ncbi:MAG: DUF5908 family protein [Nitrospirota bacterium]|nr:DUF5908 family protein [Nitrospirota bacterium]
MPIEINELVIRAVSHETPRTTETATEQHSPSEDEIIKACVKQVLQILKRQKGR